MQWSRHSTLIGAFLTLLASEASLQVPSRNEKREAKVRTEYLKATLDIHVPTIRPMALKSQLGDTNLILVDVRQENEQKVSMIPAALTPKELAIRFRSGFPPGKRIVTYCTIGYRSGIYAEQLQAKGLPVENLEGGILGWTHVSGPLVTKDSTGKTVSTHLVHVYASDMRQWIAMDYQAIW